MDELNNILFDACREGKVEVIKFLVQNNPRLISEKDAHCNTALHIACENGLLLDGIEYLCSSYPEALTIFNDEGASPFHMICYHGKSVENLKFLHKLFDEAIESPDKRGRYPIHIACEKGAPLDVITFLTEKCPTAAQKADRSQKLPLHHAIVNQLPFPTIKYLIEFYPEALRHADANNYLPFHLLFYHSNNIEIFQFLRVNYLKEFEELTINPTKVKCAPLSSQNNQKQSLPSLQNHGNIKYDVSTSHADLENRQQMKVEESSRNDQQQSSFTVQNQTIIKQDDTLNLDLENRQQMCVEEAHDKRSIKAEDSTIEEKQVVSFPIIAPLKAGRRNFQISDESDSCSDDDSCTSNESVDQVQSMATEIINDRQSEQNEAETKEKIEVFGKENQEEFNRGNYTDAVLKRPRIDSERPKGTIEKSTRNEINNGVTSPSPSKLQFRWSQDEIKLVLSGVRNFVEDDISIERMYICISQKVKTRNPRQCFDLIRRIKTKVEGNKKHTSDEYTIYKLLKGYNNYNLPSYKSGKSSCNDSTNSSTHATKLSQAQLSSSWPSSLLPSQEFSHDNYIDSVQKRRRIGSLRASTIALAFAASENTSSNKPNDDKLNKDIPNQKSNLEVPKEKSIKPTIEIAKNNPTAASASKNEQFRWTQLEKDAFISELRAFCETNQSGCVFTYISHRLKTRNFKQCYDLAHRIKMKVSKDKKCKSDEMIIYNLLQTCNDNNLTSNKDDESSPCNENANATPKATPSQSLDSPLSSLTLEKLRGNQKGAWSQSEIEIFLTALRSFNGLMEENDLFEHISNEVKTRNYKQCYDFRRSIERRFEASQSVTPEEYFIYAIFNKYEKDRVICNSTKNSNNDDSSNQSSSSLKDATTNSTSPTVLLQHSPSPSSDLKTNKERETNSISTPNSDCDDYSADANEDEFLV